MTLGYVLDDLFARHTPPGPHPERPERAVAATRALRDAGLEKRGRAVPLRYADTSEIGALHSESYVQELERVMPGKSGWLDPETYFGPKSWDAARAAVAAACDLTAGVLAGHYQRALAVVRPPGHHAMVDHAMGFCLLNNVGVAAVLARAAGARVAIVDFDVHHGNGTEAAFYDDERILYTSVHQYPFYPGTGRPEAIGHGSGQGYNINVAMPSGSGDTELLTAFDRAILPAVRWFGPDILLCSAGFDMHRDDPLAGLQVTDAGYRQVADRLVAAADQLCQGRLVCVLEGGYDLGSLGRSIVELTQSLLGRPAEQPAELSAPSAPFARSLHQTLTAHHGAPWTKEAG